MSPVFAEIDEYLNDDGIELPILGKTYQIRPVDAATGLEVSRLMGLVVDATNGFDIRDDPRMTAVIAANESAEETFEKRILGDALDQMVADKVPWPVVGLAFQTVMIWISQGVEAAARYWAAGGGDTGKDLNRKTRRATRKGRQGYAGSKKNRSR